MGRVGKSLVAVGAAVLPVARCAPDLIGIPGSIDDLQVWRSWMSVMTWGDYAWGAVFAASVVSLIVINFGGSIRRIWRRRREGTSQASSGGGGQSPITNTLQIGRASCRERVCQSV